MSWAAVAALAGAGGVACTGGESASSADRLAEVQQRAGAAAPAGSAAGDHGGHLDDEEPNGRFTLGALLDAPPYTAVDADSYFSLPTAATRSGLPQVVALSGRASLTSMGKDGVIGGADRRFDGLAFSEGGRRFVLGVAAGDADVTHYRIDVQDGAALTRLCDDAVPLAGVIDRRGRHAAKPGRLTLACADGAAHKCTVWGYPAGAVEGVAWGAHQACLQMVTANYCADGAAGTRMGTMIRFLDDVGVYPVAPGTRLPTITRANWPPAPGEFYFEAAFAGTHAPALCLARLRWPTLADGCIRSVPECPDGVDELIAEQGALLFVASQYSQLRLERWQLVGGGAVVDRVVTVRGYESGDPEEQQPPWPGYVFAGRDAVLLRVPPESLDATGLIEVGLFRDVARGDRFLARRGDVRFAGAGFADEGFEGWAFSGPGSQGGRVPLRLYRHGESGERWATTAAPEEVAASGYLVDVDASGSALIGWVAAGP